MSTLMLIGALVLGQATAGGTQRRPTEGDMAKIAQGLAILSEPPVLMAAPLSAADGSAQGPLVRITRDSRTFYVTSPIGSCDAVVSTSLPAHVREGWRVTAAVLSYEQRVPTVSVEWQRLSPTRPATPVARGNSTITLPWRERIIVDQQVVADGRAACDGQMRALELTYMAGTVVDNDGAQTHISTPLEADIFVVHQSPAGVEVFRRISVPFDPASTGFSFRLPTLSTSLGPATVTVEGTFRAIVGNSGATELSAAIVRTNTGAVPQLRGAGGTSTSVPFPETGEVLSFDLPLSYTGASGRGGGGGRGGAGGVMAGGGGVGGQSASSPFDGHQLSLRIQLRPAR